MKNRLMGLTTLLTVGLSLNGWSEPSKNSTPAVRLDFDVRATMQDRVVHSQPSMLVLDKQEATITVGTDDEIPSYKLELRTVPELLPNATVELDNDLTVVTSRGEWHRHLRFSTLLDTEAEFSFTEDNGWEVTLSVRPSLMAKP